MSAVFEDLVDCTRISHALTSHFIEKDRLDLIICKLNILQIFRTSNNLSLLHEFRFHAPLTSISSLKCIGYKTDLLLITYRGKKGALVLFDQLTATLETISLHSWEQSAAYDINQSAEDRLRVIQEERCVLLNYGEKELIILPIRQQEDFEIDEMEDEEQPPFKSSFIITTTLLSPDIAIIKNIAFLPDYLDPVLLIAYTPAHSQSTLTIAAFSLDLSSKASTLLYSITGLSPSFTTITPTKNYIFASSVDATILIDRNGSKLIYIPLNAYASILPDLEIRGATITENTDYIDWSLKLERSSNTNIDLDMLIFAEDGSIYQLTPKLQGTSLSNASLIKIDYPYIDYKAPTSIGRITQLSSNMLFISSDCNDSFLLKNVEASNTVNETVVAEVKEEKGDNMDLDDDDLYSSAKKVEQISTVTRSYKFEVLDILHSFAPLKDITIGRPYQSLLDIQEGVVSSAELLGISGYEKSGSATVFRRSIIPSVRSVFEFGGVTRAWTVSTKIYDRYLFLSTALESRVFIVDDSLNELHDTDFDISSPSVYIGRFPQNGSNIVHVKEKEITLYGEELTLEQLLPIVDDNHPVKVKYASVSNEYLLLILSNHQVRFCRFNSRSQEIEVFDNSDSFRAISGNLCNFSDLLGSSSKVEGTSENPDLNTRPESYGTVACLLSPTGNIKLIALTKMHIIFETSLNNFPSFLGLPVDQVTQNIADEIEEPSEVSLIILGDKDTASLHLLIRTNISAAIMYEAYFVPNNHSNLFLLFKKLDIGCPGVIASNNAAVEDTTSEVNFLPIKIATRSLLFCTGKAPGWIIKTSKSVARFFPIAGTKSVLYVSSFFTKENKTGHIIVDGDDTIRICGFQDGFNYDSKWAYNKIKLGRSVHATAFYDPLEAYVISTSRNAPFQLTDDDGQLIVPEHDSTLFLPNSPTGYLDLLSPNDWSVVDRHDFEDHEIALCVKQVNLEISEATKKRKQFIAVGTAKLRGEDYITKGRIYIFEVVQVNAEAGKRETTSKKLKCICKEDVRGPVTVVAEVGGYLLASQGQKVIVRTLEDGDHLVGVAFIDLYMFCTAAKAINNLIVFGDISRGISFAGFSEEPYKMSIFGRDDQYMSVDSVEFLISGKSLSMLVADARKNIHILQYEPDNPRSLGGQRLIRKSEFYVGTKVNSMILLPIQPLDPEISTITQHLSIMASNDGGLHCIQPASELIYRRFNIVQNFINANVDHNGGINPRMARVSSAFSRTSNKQKGLIDMNLIYQFLTLTTSSKTEIAKRCGVSLEGLIGYCTEIQQSLAYM